MDDQNQNPQSTVTPEGSQNTEQPVVSQDNQQISQSQYPPIFSVNSSSDNASSFNPADNNNISKKVGKFFLGGTANVDRVDRFTPRAIISIVGYVLTIGLLVGMGYLHNKQGDSWLKTPYDIVGLLGLLNIIYFGWIKRELLWGRGIMLNVVRHGTAVGISFIYIAGILLAYGIAWNHAGINSKISTNSQSSQTVQSTTR